MKQVEACMIGIIAGALIVVMFFTSTRPYKTDIEIYTDKDIYYIDGLTVTSESNELKLTFDDKVSLKNYISEITAGDLCDN